MYAYVYMECKKVLKCLCAQLERTVCVHINFTPLEHWNNQNTGTTGTLEQLEQLGHWNNRNNGITGNLSEQVEHVCASNVAMFTWKFHIFAWMEHC